MREFGVDDSDEFRCGTPSAEEWTGLWKSSPSDPDVTNEEYDRVWNVLDDRLSALGNTSPREDTHFYFRGDNFGDRTQYLEVAQPDKLTTTLIYELRSWLREPSFKQWRIAIITYLGNAGTIMVYPQVIRLGREYDEDVELALPRIIALMKQEETDSV